MSNRPPLQAQEVIKAIEHKGPARVPMMIHFWNFIRNDATPARKEALAQLHQEYPDDLYMASPLMPAPWQETAQPSYIPGYSWTSQLAPKELQAYDSVVYMKDWDMLDDVLAAWPNPQMPQMTAGLKEKVHAESKGRYVLSPWWFCFFERMWWSFRGMENMLCDFYEHPQKVHRLMDALCDFYVTTIHRVGREIGPHGMLTSDDIGMQTGSMFGPDIFREFFKPRYKRLIDACHEHNMHLWLHTCGNVLPFMEDFVEIGLDVIHPIQKYTMDEREVADKFGGRISFWSGMDVQQILPWGKPEDVRREVRFMIDTFDGPGGGCMITAGNGVTDDNPIENLRAFYDEAYTYGMEHRKRFS